MRVLLRADASAEIGSGHLVRCATLGNILASRGHQVDIACRAPGLEKWLDRQGLQMLPLAGSAVESEEADARSCREQAADAHYDWAVVDHYGLGVAWEREIARTAHQVLAIDDLGRHHDCDALLDQNYANPVHQHYPSRAPLRCTIRLGPHFALVRPEFATLRATSLARQHGEISRIMVFMGGGDPLNETTKALDGIGYSRVRSATVDVVIGANNPNRGEVEEACGRLPQARLHVQTDRMAALLAAADCVVGAAGSATWERCVLGVPALVTIMADNQAPIAAAITEAGAHRVLGWHHELAADDYAEALDALAPSDLRRMSSSAAAICDGGGADRMAELIEAAPRRSGARHAEIRLRPLQERDLPQLRSWRNNPDVSRHMFTDHLISESEHRAWFERVRHDESCVHWVIEADRVPVGSANIVDIDPVSRSASWAIYVADPALRGSGIGLCVQYCVLNHAFDELALETLRCEVLETNPGAAAMYASTGFAIVGRLPGRAIKNGEPVDALVYAITRDDWVSTHRERLKRRISARGLVPMPMSRQLETVSAAC